MVTATQIVLVVVISILTGVLVVIGVQVVKILQELRLSIQKLNRILDDTANLTHSVTQPVVGLANMAESLRGGIKLVALVRKLLGHEDTAPQLDQEGMNNSQVDRYDEHNESPQPEKELSYIEELQGKGREATQSFFHRNGRPLG